MARQPKGARDSRSHRTNDDAYFSSPNAPILLQLGVDVTDKVTRNRKSQAFAAAGLAQDKSINTDHLTARIDQRSAAAPRVDGSVRLNERLRCIGTESARGRADNTHAH